MIIVITVRMDGMLDLNLNAFELLDAVVFDKNNICVSIECQDEHIIRGFSKHNSTGERYLTIIFSQKSPEVKKDFLSLPMLY